MPNSNVSAAAEGLSKISRRGILAGLPLLPIVASGESLAMGVDDGLDRLLRTYADAALVAHHAKEKFDTLSLEADWKMPRVEVGWPAGEKGNGEGPRSLPFFIDSVENTKRFWAWIERDVPRHFDVEKRERSIAEAYRQEAIYVAEKERLGVPEAERASIQASNYAAAASNDVVKFLLAQMPGVPSPQPTVRSRA